MIPAPEPRPTGFFALHWWRLRRSVSKRWREWRLPRGFERLGTRYGGWWVYAPAVQSDPLLIDCGLGKDISFPDAFLKRFGGRVLGVDANPEAIGYCRTHCPPGMEVREAAFWTQAGSELEFHLPRQVSALPEGADGISGSLNPTHAYAGDEVRKVRSTSLGEVLAGAGREECDVLKLDIEGAEFDVLEALCKSRDIRRARQVLVEFHHGYCADRTIDDSRRAARSVEACGFRLRHTEGRNCVFVRRDVGDGR